MLAFAWSMFSILWDMLIPIVVFVIFPITGGLLLIFWGIDRGLQKYRRTKAKRDEAVKKALDDAVHAERCESAQIDRDLRRIQKEKEAAQDALNDHFFELWKRIYDEV